MIRFPGNFWGKFGVCVAVLVIILSVNKSFIFAGTQRSSDSPGTTTAGVLNLRTAFSLALKHNPMIQAQLAQRDAATYGVQSARSLFFPRVDVRETYSRSDSPVQVFSSKLSQEEFKAEDFRIDRLNHPSARTNLKTEVIVTQPVFNRGREVYRYETSRLLKEMSKLKLEQVKQQVLLSVQRAYTNWLLARERYGVIEKAVETAQKSLQLARSRYARGTALRSDVLRYEVHLASYRKELAAAKNRIDIALSALNVAMGLPNEKSWVPEKGDKQVDGSSGLSLSDWISLTNANRPELLYYRLNSKVAKWAVTRSKLNFLPSLNLRGIYEHNTESIGDVSGDAFTLMGTAEVNVFNGLGDSAEYKKASANFRSAEAYERRVRQEVRHQVQKAWLNMQTAKLQVKVTKKAVKQAEESLNIVRNRYKNGLTIVTELLDTETALLRAQLQHLQALYDYKLAFAEMKWSAGVLEKNNPERIKK